MKKILLFIILLIGGSLASAQVVMDSLVAMYSFNSGTAQDDIGSLDGSPVNATLIPDRFGNPNHAYWLNGSPNSYIKLGTYPQLKPAECSISMWVRVDSLITSGSGYNHNIMLVTKCQTGNNFYEAYALYYNISTHKIIAVTTHAPSNQQVVFSNTQNALHVWYHLVMTFDYNKVKFYLDGVYQGELTKNYTTVYLASDSIMIGNSCNTQNSRYYRGAVDDLRFYNRVISALEVDSLFHDPDPNSVAQPVALFQAEDTKICPGGCISFSSSSQNGSSFEWFFQGATPNYSTLENPSAICYTASGNYEVTLVVHNGSFTDTLTQSNYITVYSSPSPDIVQSNDTLYCNGVTGMNTYQWFFNGNSISGATNNFYVQSVNGNYSVQATNSNGCEGTDDYEVLNNAANEFANSDLGFTVYPNPFSSEFMVESNYLISKTISITNILGEEIFYSNNNLKSQAINLNSFSAGIYFLKIKTSEGIEVIKIEKQK